MKKSAQRKGRSPQPAAVLTRVYNGSVPTHMMVDNAAPDATGSKLQRVVIEIKSEIERLHSPQPSIPAAFEDQKAVRPPNWHAPFGRRSRSARTGSLVRPECRAVPQLPRSHAGHCCTFPGKSCAAGACLDKHDMETQHVSALPAPTSMAFYRVTGMIRRTESQTQTPMNKALMEALHQRTFGCVGLVREQLQKCSKRLLKKADAVGSKARKSRLR